VVERRKNPPERRRVEDTLVGVDVLFLNPGGQQATYQTLSGEFTAVATPVWTSLLADRTRRNGYTTAVYDANVEGWQDGTAGDVLSKYAPALTVMMVYGHQPSASTQTMPAAGRMARDIKAHSREATVAMGGTHPSALPERTLADEDIDFVVQGEGSTPSTGCCVVYRARGTSGKHRGCGIGTTVL